MKVKANGIDIEVEDTGPGMGAERPTVLLIMGLGMQLVAWPPAVVQLLVDAGYRVVRFDNRDIGLSQHFDHLGRPNIVWAGLKHRLGLRVKAPYTLHDMALDAVGVLDALGVYADALRFCDWLEPAEWFDSRGPNRTAVWLGVPRRAISQLGSPIDATLLRRFAAQSEHRPGETLYEYMRFVGQDLLDFLREVRESIDLVARTSERWSVAAGNEVVETVFLPRSGDGDAIPDEPSGSVARYIRAKGLERVIGATVYPDRRGSGYGISRYEDDPRLDFSQLEGQPDVHFAHKTGFVCKTTATGPERLRELIRLAVKT